MDRERDDYRPTRRTRTRVEYDSTDRPSSYSRTSSRSASSTRTTSRSASSTRATSRSGSRTYARSARSSRNSGQQETIGVQLANSFSSDNVTRNRIIAIVILVVLIIVLFNIVSCAAKGCSSNSSAQAPAASASAAASQSSATSNAASATAAYQGVESPWTDNGYFATGDKDLDQYIKNLCDAHSTSGATFDQNAYDTFIYVSRTDYIERENNQSPWGEGWDVEYAKQYFTSGDSGNCYNFVAVTEYLLKYFGYSDAEAEPCVVELESGSWGDHGLVFVTNKVDGKRAIVDDALSANGWMLDINEYNYDIRNINQNSTIKGNVDVLTDEPMQIQPGHLTDENDSQSNSTNEDEEYYDDGSYEDEEYYDEEGSEDEYYSEDEEE